MGRTISTEAEKHLGFFFDRTQRETRASRASAVTVSTLVSATSQGYTPAMPRPLRCTCIMIR